MRQKLLLVLFALLIALGGCGSGDGDQSQGSEQSTTAMSGPPGGTAAAEGKEAQKAQKGSKAKGSETEPKTKGQESQAEPKRDEGATTQPAISKHQAKALRRNFPKPKPVPGAEELSTGSIQAGEEACKGLTPTEVKQRFYAKAQANLDPEQIELIEELPRYEAEAPKDPSFVAGQIAATVYGATLGEAERQYGFQGCVYSLALGLGE